ncbi:MAG: hypothetical protein JW770_01415, partial [Actinobacteria bacterium]|nr:hypothetical protein [Actinomycetota bacterium]
KLEKIVEAASIKGKLKKLNIGVIGHPFPGMLDVAVDSKFVAEIGPKITRIELSELEGEIKSIKSGDVDNLIAEVKKKINTEYVSRDDLYKAVRLFIAYEHLSKRYGIGSLTVLCQDYVNVVADAPSCLALSLMQNRSGLATGCEGDIPNTIGAFILKKLTGLSPMFVDWTMYDEKKNVIFFQHCGVADPDIVSCPVLKPHTERFGYSGEGVAFEVTGKPGEVTMLSLINDSNGWKMFGSEGMAIESRPFSCGLNQMQVKIDREVKDYLENVSNMGLTHHLNIGYGHVLEELKYLAKILKVNFLSL